MNAISSEQYVSHPTINQFLGILMFAFTLSSSSSLVPPAAGISPLCASQQSPLTQRAINRPDSRYVVRSLTASSHLRISSTVHPSGSPFGSGSVGNMSLPHIDQAAAAVTAPPNAVSC